MSAPDRSHVLDAELTTSLANRAALLYQDARNVVEARDELRDELERLQKQGAPVGEALGALRTSYESVSTNELDCLVVDLRAARDLLRAAGTA